MRGIKFVFLFTCGINLTHAHFRGVLLPGWVWHDIRNANPGCASGGRTKVSCTKKKLKLVGWEESTLSCWQEKGVVLWVDTQAAGKGVGEGVCVWFLMHDTPVLGQKSEQRCGYQLSAQTFWFRGERDALWGGKRTWGWVWTGEIRGGRIKDIGKAGFVISPSYNKLLWVTPSAHECLCGKLVQIISPHLFHKSVSCRAQVEIKSHVSLLFSCVLWGFLTWKQLLRFRLDSMLKDINGSLTPDMILLSIIARGRTIYSTKVSSIHFFID